MGVVCCRFLTCGEVSETHRQVTAAGRIVDRTWFIQLRDERFSRSAVADVVRGDDTGEKSMTTIGPYELAGHRGAMPAIGLRVPCCRQQYSPPDPDDGVGELWFLNPWSGRGPATSLSLRTAATRSSACASGAFDGCGARSRRPTPGGLSRNDPTSRTGCSPSTPTHRKSSFLPGEAGGAALRVVPLDGPGRRARCCWLPPRTGNGGPR